MDIRVDDEFRSLIPPLAPDERAQLEQNILRDGCRDALVVWDGLLLDGHNRYDICTQHGLAFQTMALTLADRQAAEDWIITNQLGRRNLTADQFRYYLGRHYNRIKRQGARTDLLVETSRQVDGMSPQPAAECLADDYGVSARTVERAGKLAAQIDATPELREAVMQGKPLLQVQRDMKKSAREERRQENQAKVQAAPDLSAVERVFSAILIDPPWDWGDEGDVNQLGRAKADYATMAFEDLLRLPVERLADDDAHLYLWITNRSLPKGFRLLEEWGFRYITAITWVKPHFGMGNYFRGQTEHLLFGVRGSLPLQRKDQGTVFHAPRGDGGHSSKPAAAYELIESCSPGPYVEMFARGGRDGWATWGEDGLRLSGATSILARAAVNN